ncbi:TraX family protein [Lachnobacterium bovis]|uniref:TraX family protein n=1 Tax=Lachnobacterium bovis TaxID=140626 RepID=UPI0003B56010|nr:TraX family protein [Lachnobacterium bovis]
MDFDFFKKETYIRKKIPMPASYLKYIAIIIMLIDHIGAALLEREVWFFYQKFDSYEMVLEIDEVLRSIGRIAFPLFAFMIAEGAIHTRNIKKYAVRLFIFGVISEIPFDLAFFDKPFYFDSNNVFFTLAIAVAVIMLQSELEKIQYEKMLSYQEVMIGKMLILGAGVLAAYFLNTDYSACGVLVIYVMYSAILLGQKEIGYIVGVVLLILMCGEIEKWSIFGIIFIYLYNGERGKQNKYLFYIFYPGHLILLTLIRFFLFK